MNKILTHGWKRFLTGLPLLTLAGAPLPASAALEECTPEVLGSPDMFNCVPSFDEEIPVPSGPASTFEDPTANAAFPDVWHQYGFDQRHNPAFPGNETTDGTFWAAPLTGIDFLRAARAQETFGNPEGWASRTGQFLGEVMGVAAANGIIYAQLGNNTVHAMDATTGRRIWEADLVNVMGMGQTIVHEVDGSPVVFIPVGDAAFNIQNTIDFANSQPHDRGASFGAVVALDGVTGEQLWRFPVSNAERPAPIFDDGKLYVATGAGEFLVVDAATGMELGSTINPGDGFPGLASPNWYETDSGQKLVIYGTLRPRRLLAMDVTDPANPVLAWESILPGATANSPGDTPVAVDPASVWC